MESSHATNGAARKTSLRTRWNRIFAVLLLVILTGGVAVVIATGALAEGFRSTADQVQREDALRVRLRADLARHTGQLHQRIDLNDVDEGTLTAAALAVESSFEALIRSAADSAELPDLLEADRHWDATAASVRPIAPDAPLLERLGRHQSLVVGTEEVMALVDRSAEAGQPEIRAALARAGRFQTAVLVTMVAGSSALLLVVLHLGRRLSGEVLRPVAVLRDSANQLAGGEFDHRVVVDRTDELGDLAASFNAMADAIAGSRRSLVLEATTDSLTGLLNRAAFRARLDAALSRPSRRSGREAVLFVDLDDFKDVNDSRGHAAGDVVLRVVAARLGEVVRPGDVVARLGGDEFALLLDDLGHVEQGLAVAERVVAALAEPVEIGGSWAHVGASVGLAMRDEDSTVDTIMREADIAMYAAKGQGKNRVESYSAGTHQATVARDVLRVDVVTAVERGELILEYQPVVALGDGTLMGLEALVRWQHPTRGLLPPSEFIDLAEETGAAASLGAWVLDTAFDQLRRWQRRHGLAGLWLAVNVSRAQLDQPAFADLVWQVVRRNGLDPTCVVLEVPDAAFAADDQGVARRSLRGLRRDGVRVAYGDLRPGGKAIGRLRGVGENADIVKLHRSLLSGLGDGDGKGDGAGADEGAAGLDAVVREARHLDLEVVCQGVEALEQLVAARAVGCPLGQGFLFSRPVGGDAVEALLAGSGPLPDVGLWEAASRAAAAPVTSLAP